MIWFCLLVLAFAAVVGARVLYTLEKLMSAISDFNTEMRATFAAMAESVDGLTSDITQLTAKIAELSGSPEDAVMLAELKAIGAAMAERIEALNALTPPEVP